MRCGDSSDFGLFGAAAFSRKNSNSRSRDFQNFREKAAESIIGAPFERRSLEANLQTALPFARDFVAAGAGLDAHGEDDGVFTLLDFNHLAPPILLLDCMEREDFRLSLLSGARTARCRRGFPSRLLRWPLRNPETSPWREPAARGPHAWPGSCGLRAALRNKGACARRHREAAGCTSGRLVRGGAARGLLRQGRGAPLPTRRSWKES